MDKILRIPDSKYDYEFMVVIPAYNGDYIWHSNYETAEVYDVAKKVGGVVVHNVRIYRKEKKVDKH